MKTPSITGLTDEELAAHLRQLLGRFEDAATLLRERGYSVSAYSSFVDEPLPNYAQDTDRVRITKTVSL